LEDRKFVFLDARGKRWRRWRLGIIAAVLIGFVGAVSFAYSLFVTPDQKLPPDLESFGARFRQLRAAEQGRPVAETIPLWRKFIKADKPTGKHPAQSHPPAKNPPMVVARDQAVHPRPIRIGYTVPWDANSFDSLEQHYQQLTHVCAEWLTIADSLGTLAVTADPQVREFAAGHGLNLMLLLTNLVDDAWQPEGVEGLANGPASRREQFNRDLLAAVKQAGARGVVVDWGQLDPAYRDQIAALLLEMAGQLHDQGRELWLSIPMGNELKAFDLETLAAGSDHFIAVLHDENGEGDDPGPIASKQWVEGWLQVVTGYGEPDQWIFQLGSYGYDWTTGEKTAETLSFADVMARASLLGLKQCSLDASTENPSFSYEESGRQHTVWFLDAITFWNQLHLLQPQHPAGVAVYRLGTEDPGVWSVLAAAAQGELPAGVPAFLARVPTDATITHIGKGDFLTVHEAREDGARTVRLGTSGRLWEAYERFPKYLTLWRQGGDLPEQVAISFDDGPDPEWTPQILDILKEHGATASFFVVGRKVEKDPDLLRRIVAEGHEVGIHTYTHPNLAEVSEDRAMLEINATRRLIESVTGRSTILFRPPYNADSSPHTHDEIFPVKLAQAMGYVTVTEDVDPEDWSLPGAAAILDRVKRQRRLGGNILLLHDAGGDRTETLEALPAIIDYLETRGDRVVPLASLLNQSRDALMPPLVGQETVSERVSLTGFQVLMVVERVFWSFVVVATLLVVLRSLLIIVLACRHRLRQGQRPTSDFGPPVSVLIAAFNEAKVIGGTIDAVLTTTYPNDIEVVVVDDGSNDDTAAIVAAAAAADPRVRLLRQPNRGKAAALARGLAAVNHEIVVTLDADTRFRTDTIAHLVEPFADPKVAAVSGHARVGNLGSFIARCQALEYISGFNLDRRAYHLVNCITVVPGAVSALRKSAVIEAGGFSTDTLAEDTDLTLSLQRLGRSVVYAPRALAWTEAPESLRGLARQRFRWAFGTLQCLWKHKDMVFHPRYRAIGLVGLPNVWFFQIFLVAFTPILDLVFLASFLLGASQMLIIYFFLFLLMDLVSAVAACLIEREPLRWAWLSIPMRFIYRPILGWVVWRSLYKALQGAWVRWGKADRTAAFNYLPQLREVHGED